MDGQKAPFVRLLSVKPMHEDTCNNNVDIEAENNNMLHDYTHEMHEMELKDKQDTFAPIVKKRSRAIYILGWTFIVCALLLLIIAVALVIKFTVFAPGVPDEHKINTTISTPGTHPVTTVPTIITTVSVNTSSSSSLSSSTSSSSTSSSSTTTLPPVTTKISTTPSSTTTTPLIECGPDEFSCRGGVCIPEQQVCDSIAQCPLADDELDCPCGEGEWQCSSGECVKATDRCDRRLQCKDWSDEMNCPDCRQVGFQCASGLCLWSNRSRCDIHVDCPDLSDETNCWLRKHYRRCDNGLQVPDSKWCDGVDDCFDNSDESDAECQKPETCNFLFEIPCTSGGCYHRQWKCDGHYDCADQSDEQNCGSCSSTQFQCVDYKCINRDQVCDGVKQCDSGEDELDCMETVNSAPGTLLVQSGQVKLPVCGDVWDSNMADDVCQYLGQGSSIGHTLVPVGASGVPVNGGFLKVSQQYFQKPGETILARFTKTFTCTSSKVVGVQCAPESCGARQVEALTPFIYGGNLAALGKWPWVASLSHLGSNICGGVIISDRWVLTAGHCIVQKDQNYTMMPHQFSILAGTVERDRPVDVDYQLVGVGRIVLHPRLARLDNGQLDWDMVLLELRTPLKFTDNVQPICLHTQHAPQLIPSKCYLAGWGFINTHQESVRSLRDGKLTLLDDSQCGHHGNTVNTNSTMCAGYAYGLISGCQGDSGSPLMCEDTQGTWRVAGLMSHGVGGCDDINRFSRVSTSVSWIQTVLSNT